MRLLLYSWGANNDQILADNLKKLGFELLWFDKPCRHFTRDMELATEMIPYIHRERIEGVISFNYFPIISMICDTCKIPYYAWIYDCPHFTLYARQVTLACNHIGVFDREMVQKLQDKGVTTVYHVPLSVDVEYFKNRISMEESFRSDISFVGSLYTDEHNYFDRLLSDQEKAVFDPIIAEQCFAYDRDHLRAALNTGVIDLRMIQTKMEKEGLMLGEDYFADTRELLQSTVLEKKVTVEERRIILNRVAEIFGERYRFCLYTSSDLQAFPLLKKCYAGVVDYHTQMPCVFAGSRINLNISLRSIHSGIPLRVLDIMACGGFVLTNWQPEIEEYFVEGKELVIYRSMEECQNKISYYLEHDRERADIAKAGQIAAQERFGYRRGLSRLFAI